MTETTSRRAVIGAAVWSVPVVAAAAAAPLAAASQCAEWRIHSGTYYWMQFGGINNNGTWNSNSGTLTVYMAAGTDTRGALSYSAAATGINAATTQHRWTVTVPYRVSWTTVPAGYSAPTETNAGGGNWTYTSQRLGTIPTRAAVTPLGTIPTSQSAQNAISTSNYFIGSAYQLPFANNQQVTDGPTYAIPVTTTTNFALTFPASSCNTGPISRSLSYTIPVRPTRV
ncbi:hypothetical protein [Pseudoclavibacter helvolus]|uniref:hypothetical protein n=1 Tax=Pseudoclavibacter helvolus TaxID=255205 RepID=UPI003C719545